MFSLLLAAVAAFQPYDAVTTEQAVLFKQANTAEVKSMKDSAESCMPDKGTRVHVVDSVADTLMGTWKQVQVVDGDCAGLTGWVSSRKLEASR